MSPSKQNCYLNEALQQAITLRNPDETLIHSDRRSQYCSADYVDCLREKEIQIS